MLTPDLTRLQQDFNELKTYGTVGPNAVTRIAFTDSDNQAHQFVEKQMVSAGLDTRYDSFGNLFGRRPGKNPGASSVVTGSHLDGPPNGGLYDGTVGVLCALEALRMIGDAGIETIRPLEVAAIRCEHLDRFGLSCLGSRAISGKLTVEHLNGLKDDGGATLGEVLDSVGFEPDRVPDASREGDIRYFLELHVEQGRVLEDAGQSIGIVTSISGPTRYEIVLEGIADHSGGTPMNLRRDALCGASEIVLELERLAHVTDGCVATIGRIEALPGAVHTIPGVVRLWVDIRGTEAQSKRELVRNFEEFCRQSSSHRGLALDISVTVDEDPVPTSSEIILTLTRVLNRLNIPFLEMPSGGGHDSQHLASITEAGMFFVPSAGGISHTPQEFTSVDDMLLGCRALAESLLDLAEPA